MKKIHYLKGITSIRFFLSLLVLIGHCSQNLEKYDITWGRETPILQKGELAVEFFFTLSGFLLTYLAYIEYRTYSKINIRFFFIRRILRIFPLYYFVVFIGYFMLGILFPILKGENYLEFPISEGLLYHIFFLPNWVISKYPSGAGSLYSLWSIGVEEQFYLFFPFLCIFLFKKKKLILNFGLITILYFIFYKFVQESFLSQFSFELKSFVYTLKFHFMFLGGFFALMFYTYRKIFDEIFSSSIIQVVIFLLFLLTIFKSIPILKQELIYGVIFCLFIISLTNKSNLGIKFDNKYLKYLGSISFGIYVYHPIVSYPLRYLIESNSIFFQIITSIPILYYIIEILVTILVSHLSYKYYESKFLKLKERYVL